MTWTNKVCPSLNSLPYYIERYKDHDWLLLLNTERKKDGVDPVSQEVFEVIMDQLEKEWFTLVKRIYRNLQRVC